MPAKAEYYTSPRAKYPRRKRAPMGHKPIPKHIKHGTSTCYMTYGCSCAECKAWMRAYSADRRENERRSRPEKAVNTDSKYYRAKQRKEHNRRISEQLGLVTA